MNRLLVELIGYRLGLVTFGQTKLFGRNEREDEPLHVTVRAIALDDLLEVGIHLESVFPAVAPARVGFHMISMLKGCQCQNNPAANDNLYKSECDP